MKIEKGYCRIILKSGLVAFGEVIEIKDKYILFNGFSPSAIGRKIPLENIVLFEKHSEEEIPGYE
jgi:hypothetical protein